MTHRDVPRSFTNHFDLYATFAETDRYRYDGVVFHDVTGEDNGNIGRAIDEYVPFKGAQIKSATDNNGAFSTEDNDILFRDGESEASPRAGGETAGGRWSSEKAAAAREGVAALGLVGRVRLLDDASGLRGLRAMAKGWYDRGSGKIIVVLGNHTDAGDVMRTLLHEGVAHNGFRSLLGERFGGFLDDVYEYASPAVREDLPKDEGGLPTVSCSKPP